MAARHRPSPLQFSDNDAPQKLTARGRHTRTASSHPDLISPLVETRRSLQLHSAPGGDSVAASIDVYSEWGAEVKDGDEEEKLQGEDGAMFQPMDEEAIAATLFGSLGPRGFLALVTCTFALWVYAAIVSKLLPPTGYWMLDAIQADHYFCYMVPLTLPVTVYFVIWNWFGLKLYKHN